MVIATRFTDEAGREWAVEVNCGTLWRVRDALGVNLTADLPAVMERLAKDPALLANVLFVVCERQADGRGVSDEEFGRGLRGEAIGRAAGALVAALVEFSPSPAWRAYMAALIEGMEEVREHRERTAGVGG